MSPSSTEQTLPKYYVGLLCLLAFSIPIFKVWSTIPMVLLAIYWLASGNWSSKWYNLKTRPTVWLWVLFYGLYLLGMVYTENAGFGWGNVKGKVPLFALPLMIGSMPSIGKQWRKVFQWFGVGVVSAILVSLGYAAYVYVSSGENIFFYMSLLELIKVHPTHFALYINFCLLFVLYDLLYTDVKWSLVRKLIYTAIAILMVVFMVLLAARMQIIVSLLVSVGMVVVRIFQRANWKMLVGFTAVIALLVTLLWSLDFTRSRFYYLRNYKFDFQQEEKWNGASVRLAIWTCATQLIEDKPVLGYGTGDSQDALQSQYEKNHFDHATLHRYNAHNQYLQTTLEVGLLGLFAFLAALFAPLDKQDAHYKLWLALVLLTMVTESLLMLQGGIVFMAMWAPLLLYAKPKPSE